MAAISAASQMAAALAITAQAGELRRAAAWLEQAANAGQVPAADTARLDLCLHEALANIIDHGGLKADSEVRLTLEVHDDSATLTLVDAGRPFDLTVAATPARPRTLQETQPGGLGVVIIRSNSDALNYRRQDGRNRLDVTVRWTTA